MEDGGQNIIGMEFTKDGEQRLQKDGVIKVAGDGIWKQNRC